MCLITEHLTRVGVRPHRLKHRSIDKLGYTAKRIYNLVSIADVCRVHFVVNYSISKQVTRPLS